MGQTQDILNGLNNLAEQQVGESTKDCVKRKKVTVTAVNHPNTLGNPVISVQEPFGTPFEVPFAPALVNVQVGDTVWIEWVYGFSNACAVNSGAWQASDLPNCVIPTEDGLEMQVNYETVMSINEDGLNVNGVIHGNVVNTDSSTAATVNGKIQDTINNLGKYLEKDVTITVPSGTYVENVTVCGFCGPGKLTISFASGAFVKGDWTIRGNNSVTLNGTVGESSYPEFTGVSNEAAMEVSGTKYFCCSGIALHGAQRSATFKQVYGVLVDEGSYAYLYTMVIDRFDYAVYVKHANLDIADCSGGIPSTNYATVANLVNGVVISPYGGHVNARGSIPMGPNAGALSYTSNGYPFFIYGQGSSSGGGGGEGSGEDTGDIPSEDSGSVEPTPNTDVTTTWNANAGYYTYTQKADTYLSICVGWLGDGTYKLRMGKAPSDKRYLAGIWLLENADTIASTLANASITKATVTITRTTTVGSTGGNQNVVLYYHGLSSVAGYTGKCDPFEKNSASTDKYIDCGCPGQYIGLGETGTFELPSALYPLLKNGTIKGFGVGMNHPTSMYHFTPTGCVLTVTYKTP